MRSNLNRQNVERLVLGCIDADLYNQILILQHFPRSTRFTNLCTAPISKFQQKIVHNFLQIEILTFSKLFKMFKLLLPFLMVIKLNFDEKEKILSGTAGRQLGCPGIRRPGHHARPFVTKKEENNWPPNPKRYFLEQQLQIRTALMF